MMNDIKKLSIKNQTEAINIAMDMCNDGNLFDYVAEEIDTN